MKNRDGSEKRKLKEKDQQPKNKEQRDKPTATKSWRRQATTLKK
jgi:hypothetical protein